jgi:hypothetical protein
MAIGMISLLTLFPIGMLNMADAIRSSRFAYTGKIAESLAEMPRSTSLGVYNLRTDPYNVGALTNVAVTNQTTTAGLDAYNAAGPFYDDTTNPKPASPWYPWLFDTTQAGPPVFIDPQGQSLWPNRTIGTDPNNVPVVVTYKNGTQIRSFGIRRVGVSWVSSTAEIRRTFMLEDELTFEPNGEVRRSPAGLIERERRHSWAYMWRRPRFNEMKVADLVTTIFQGRQIEGVAGFGNAPEPYFKGYQSNADGRAFVAGSTVARLVFDRNSWATLPAKRGDLLLDATVIPPRPNANPALNVPAHFNGYFYRIVGVSDPVLITGTQYYQELELARPALNDGYIGVMITGLADVVEKSDGKMPPG